MARERYSKFSSAVMIALLMGLLVSSIAQNVGATHQPADKVVASGSTLAVFAPATNAVLLTTTLKTSKPTDLMIHVTYECSILTKLETAGGNVSTETDSASGQIRSWIEVQTGLVTRIVPINSASSPPQDGSTPNSGDKAKDSAVFCDRTYERRVDDRENNDPPDGIDGERDYIRTRSANAFNWVLLNAGSGVHTIRLMADLVTSDGPATCTPTTISGGTCSTGFVGNRTFIVEPAKLANDATI